MQPLCFDSLNTQALIELVILPHMDYTHYISDLLYNKKHLFILDTQGSLYQTFGANKFIDKSNESENNIHYAFIYSTSDLFSKLANLRKQKSFNLLIDSITFVGDKAPNSIKSLSKALWAIVYDCNATVIVINHYRIGKEKRTYKLVPRMGLFWEQALSYRVKFYYKNKDLRYTIENKSLYMNEHSVHFSRS